MKNDDNNDNTKTAVVVEAANGFKKPFRYDVDRHLIVDANDKLIATVCEEALAHAPRKSVDVRLELMGALALGNMNNTERFRFEFAWLASRTFEVNCDKGFENGDWSSIENLGMKLMLVVCEVAEAMEGERKGLMDDKLPHRSMLEVELADVVIRCMNIAQSRDLDLPGAIVEKHRFNSKRPHMHGGKRC